MADSERMMIPLLTGAFERSQAIRCRAQILFLDIVASTTPAPLIALRDEVLPCYRAVFKVEKERGIPDAETSALSCSALVDLVHGSTNAHVLLRAAGEELIRWSERFNLKAKQHSLADRATQDPEFYDEYWPIATALETILFWHFHPIGPIWERHHRWRPPLFRLTVELQAPPVSEALPTIRLQSNVIDPTNGVDAPGWQMTLETASDFRKRMRSAFECWLDGHIAGREASARAAGLVPAPEKRKLVPQFTWLARYQVEKISSAKLGRDYNLTTATIEDGIESALKLIHLEKRPAERGGAKGDRHPKRSK